MSSKDKVMPISFEGLRPRLLSRRAGLLLAALTWPQTQAYGVTTARLIEVDPQHRTDAVAITAVTIGGSPVQCGLVTSPHDVQAVTPIQADDDWLKNTTIVLLNRTNKMIVFGQIVLAFPETGAGTSENPQRVFAVTIGRLPPSVAISGSTGKPLSQDPQRASLLFAPGQKLEIHLADYIDQIRASIEAVVPSAVVTKCRIHMGSFVFDDGMRWDGTYSVPDPQHPGKFNQLDGKYFPGTPKWPPDYHK